MNRTSLRIAVVIFAMGGLSSCAAIQDSQIFQPGFWSNSAGSGKAPVDTNNEAELGLAELTKGDNIRAQAHFDKALKANPADVQALYGAAIMYQNNGQTSRARQLYEQILDLKPRPTDETLIFADKRTHPIVEVAQVNLQLLKGNPMSSMPGEDPSMPVQQAMGQQGMGQQPGVEQGMVMPQSQLYVSPQYQPRPQAPVQAAQPMFKDADLNIVARFKAMRALLDEGLITQEEFVQRRQVNLGALLPMTAPPAATGLDRPVPQVDQISGRLRAIGRALEMRALSPAQHSAERTMILDALMPEHPASTTNPPPPPKGLMEAADAVRRLEMLKAADLITSDEYAKERAAIEHSMQPNAAPSVMGGAQQNQAMGGNAKPALTGFQPAVHLASYRKKGAAARGWAELTKRFGQLSGLEMSVERVDLGATKGVFYRLKAGPLPSNDAAKDLCRKLKAKRQYCEPTTINLG